MSGLVLELHKLAAHIDGSELALVLASWVTALLGAVWVYRQQAVNPSLAGFRAYCFPRALLLSRTARLDYGFLLVRKLCFPLMIGPFILTTAAVLPYYQRGLTAALGTGGFSAPHWWDWLAFILLAWLMTDLMDFLFHLACHRLPIFWEFHKVHHTAEELLPITNRREHPLEEIIDGFQRALTIGALAAVFFWIYGTSIEGFEIDGVDVYFIGRLLCFYHLRHSHIYMRFGWLERIFLSPAHHQLHHAVETEYWDKNFALAFSFWDRMAGTLATPPSQRCFHMGLQGNEGHEYRSVWRLYLVPLWRIGRLILRLPPDQPAIARPARIAGAAE